MGLKCSHQAFRGTYGEFHRFRQVVANAAGGSMPPHYKSKGKGIFDFNDEGQLIIDDTLEDHEVYLPEDIRQDEKNIGLFVFLLHSDYEGEISPDMCFLIANSLIKLLPVIKATNYPFIPKKKIPDLTIKGVVHNIQQWHNESYSDIAEKFIRGCQRAADANEPLLFD